jgi:murein DD-endopeptidase MepM/ murein hydrolase activator NlpD
MKDRVKSSGGAIRVALIGVATIMLGGCSETGQFGNTFGNPFNSASLPHIDKTPTGSIAQANPSPAAPFTDFFKEAFKPFDDKPAQPQPARAPYASRPAAPAPYAAAPSAPISSAPLAPPVASAPQLSAPAVKPTYALKSAPNAIGGWTSEGGTPVVLAQGETVDMVAQRYGVPTDTLLQLNGFSNRAQVGPGARLTIPVYHAGARTAAAAAPALASRSLVGEERQQVLASQAKTAQAKTAQVLTAPKMDAATLAAEKRARLAEAEKAKAEKLKAEKAALAQANAAKQSAQAKTASAAVTLAAPKGAVAAQVAQAQTFVKAAPAAPAATVAKAAPAVAAAAAPAAKAETTKVAKAETVDSDATASLQPATTASAAPDSANPEFRWPARGRVIQGFGNGGNDGINIAVPEGTQVKAAESGVVAYAGSELKGYGNLVLIRHPNGFVTAYANNGALNVKRGDTVKRGQTIALSGQSGNVSSPQLHFELRKGNKPVDPSTYLAGL